MEKNLSNDSDVVNFYSSWKTFLQARSSDYYSLLDTILYSLREKRSIYSYRKIIQSRKYFDSKFAKFTIQTEINRVVKFHSPFITYKRQPLYIFTCFVQKTVSQFSHPSTKKKKKEKEKGEKASGHNSIRKEK